MSPTTAGPGSPLPGADLDALTHGHLRDQPLRRAPRVPSWALKVVMAVSGSIFALFLLVHMVGNLKIFISPEGLNHYAYWLRTLFEPLLPWEGVLWIMRIVLLAALVGHVGAAVMLSARARRSRGAFPRRRLGARSFAARTMPVSGVVIFGFVIFHLMDLTLGTPGAAADGYQHVTTEEAFAYQNVVASFQRPWAALAYCVALLTLFLHLAHGLWTVVQDLGVTGRRARAVGYAIAGIVPLAILMGNICIPIAVVTGLVS